MTHSILKKNKQLSSYLLVLVLLHFAAGDILAQERIHRVSINTWLATHPNQKMLKSRISEQEAKSGGMVQLPFIDDFSTDRFPGNAQGRVALWTSRQATLNSNMARNPPTIGVVTLDGANEVGYPYSWSVGSGSADTLSSVLIDLSGNTFEDQIGISFYWQAQGNAPFPPNAVTGDSLRLEFYAPDLDQWFWAWSTMNVSNPNAFTFEYIPIVHERYLKEGFRFRFRNFASLQGAYDPWNIDYVVVDRNGINSEPQVDDVAFSGYTFSLMDGYTSIPNAHFASLSDPLSFMKEGIEVQLRNLSGTNRTLVGNELRILHEGDEIASFPNANSPAIQAGNTLDYFHSVGQSPNGFVFDTQILQDGWADFTVEFVHGVADISATASNDTLRFTQRFETYYAYDDGSAEWAYDNATNGAEVAMRYNLYTSDSLFALQIYTMPMAQNWENTSFTVLLWEDTGNGPGIELASAQKVVTYGQESYQQSIVYSFDEPIALSAGSYFVGYRQSIQSEGIKIGIDRNSNGNAGNLFFRSQATGWAPSQIQGSVMIRPMFTTDTWEGIVASSENTSRPERVPVYPNPARDHFRADLPQGESYLLEMYSAAGQMVESRRIAGGERVNVSHVPEGFYLLRFSDAQGGTSVQKLVIKR